MGAQESRGQAPCRELLQSYVDCMEAHRGVAPDPYEGEYCEVEKNAYRACRAALKESKSEEKKASSNEQQQQ